MAARVMRQTSAEARGAILDGLPRLRRQVLKAIAAAGRVGLTADEAAALEGLSPLSTRPRCTELAEAGLIRDAGERRRNASGRNAVVWEAVR